MRTLIPDKITIGNRQYPRTEMTAPSVTLAVAINVNKQ